MKKEEMTIDEVYRELKDDIQGMATKHDLKVGLDELRNEFKADMSKMRTWVISLFIGAVVIMGTLVGAYANMTIALLK